LRRNVKFPKAKEILLRVVIRSSAFGGNHAHSHQQGPAPIATKLSYLENKRATEKNIAYAFAYSSALDFFAVDLNRWQKYQRCEDKRHKQL